MTFLFGRDTTNREALLWIMSARISAQNPLELIEQIILFGDIWDTFDFKSDQLFFFFFLLADSILVRGHNLQSHS